MKLARFGDERLGLVDGTTLKDVTAALDVLPAFRYPLPSYDVMIANLDRVKERACALSKAASPVPLSSVKLLSPVANPGKVVGAPVNYQKHLNEVREQAELHHNNAGHTAPIHTAGVFLKAGSSVVGPSEGIALRKLDRRNDHEVELGFVIAKEARNVPASEALTYIAGYVIGLDITIRGPEERSLRKSVDSYTVVGPWLVTPDEIGNPGELDLQIAVNGETRQSSNTKYLILDCAHLIEYASSFYTLYPGDIVITGTPEGVSAIQPGDTIVATIEKIGTMEVAVREA